MTLTLVDRSITYPYGGLDDVLVIVSVLLFLEDFVILEMPKDSETPLFIGSSFLEIDELILRFYKEKVVFNVFEAMKH